MARASKLTPEQWEQIRHRMVVGGESGNSLAKEFGISEAAIRKRFSSNVSAKVRTVAVKLAEAQSELAQLPIKEQYAAMGLADKLRNISNSLASAAELGAATGHRLHGIANQQAQMIDDASPDIEVLKLVSALAKVGNEAMAPGLTLLTATKKAAEAFDDAESEVPRRVTVSVVDASA